MNTPPDKSKQITAFAWNRYTTRNLAIVPTLLGKKHTFTFRDHEVQITLPEDALEVIVNQPLITDEQESQIHLDSWREESGIKVPVSLGVDSVDLTIKLTRKIKVHQEMVMRSPNAYDILNDQEVSQFNSIVTNYRAIADEVFEFWLNVLRWQSRMGAIGRPHIRDYHSGWSTYLIDDESRNRIWSGPNILTITKIDPISVDVWDRTEKSLLSGERSPLYFDFYFDGIEHSKVGEFQRSVVDFAISCEVLIRGKVMGKLPEGLIPPIEKYVDEANIRNVLTKFFPWLLSTQGKGKFDRISSKLHQLFNARNDIMHSGHSATLTKVQIEGFRATTESLMSLDDDPTNWV